MNANPLGAFGGRDSDGGGVSVLSVATTLALLIIAGVVVAVVFI